MPVLDIGWLLKFFPDRKVMATTARKRMCFRLVFSFWLYWKETLLLTTKEKGITVRLRMYLLKAKLASAMQCVNVAQ